MKIYIQTTVNLGDFLNAMPVLSGISKSYNTKIDLIIRHETSKFLGIIDLLKYQPIFSSVSFDINSTIQNPRDVILMSSWTREDSTSPIRPIETCRYENYVKDNYNLQFDVDDEFILSIPELSLPIKDAYYVGDRWDINNIDTRRYSNVLAYLKESGMELLDYRNSLIVNSYILKNLRKPFITNFTGVAVLADMLNVSGYVLWDADFYLPEYRKGTEVVWGGHDIQANFKRHFYSNRQLKLLHKKDLLQVLNNEHI